MSDHLNTNAAVFVIAFDIIAVRPCKDNFFKFCTFSYANEMQFRCLWLRSDSFPSFENFSCTK